MKLPNREKIFKKMDMLNPYIFGGMFTLFFINALINIIAGEWNVAFWILMTIAWAVLYFVNDRFLSRVLKSYGEVVDEYGKAIDLLKEISDKVKEAKNENN